MAFTTHPFLERRSAATEVEPALQILVVDGADETRHYAEETLADAGFELKVAASVLDGAEFALAHPPSLVLSDVTLGREDGFELLARLRRNPATANIPVLFMTTDVSASITAGRRQGLFLSVNDFLPKPFGADFLLQAVRARLHGPAGGKNRSVQTQTCLAQILESTIDVTLLVEADTLQVAYVNGAGRRLFGFPPGDELPGRTLGPLCAAETLAQLTETTFPSARQGHPWQGELVFRSAQGREVPVSAVVLYHVVENYEGAMYSIVAHDITQRRELEESLRQNEEYLKTIFGAIQNGIVIVDALSQEIIEVNETVVRLTGRPKKTLLGLPFHALVSYETPVAFPVTHLRQLTNTSECTLLDHKGLNLPALRTSVPLRLRGRRCLLECLTDLSAHKEIESELRASELRFRTLVTATYDGMVMVDPEGRISFWNASAERILGYASTEVIGQDLDRLLRPARRQDPAGDGLTRIKRAGQGGAVAQSMELIVQHKEGREVPVELSLSSVVIDYRWHAIGIFRDISLRKQADATLQLAHAAMDAAANGVVITDTSGVILWVNQAYSSLTGYPAEEVIGRTTRVYSSGQHDRDFYVQMWARISSGQIWQGELCNRRKDGTLYHEEMTITPVRQHGKITHFIAIKQDIAARKKQEEERRHMEIQLRQAQKLESIGQLAAGIAHEINTPVQFVGDNIRFMHDALPHFTQLIRLHKELLAAARQSPALAELAARAEAALRAGDVEYLLAELPTAVQDSMDGIERIGDIVRAMKEFSHPSLGERVPSDLNRAIRNTVTVARNEWKYVANLVLELDPDPPPVPCYLGEINQAVLNLIVNSAHAIGDVVRDQPGVKGTITIRTRRVDDAVEIQIADTGGGIPEAIRHRIYDPFFTTKDVGKGTGQGLTIVHNTIVNRHGGTLRFETTLGAGTTFYLQLPLTEAASAAPAAEVPA